MDTTVHFEESLKGFCSRVHTDSNATTNAEASDSSAVTDTTTSGEVERDHQYYFEDGDFVIRVENTLFKVHRFLLSRDSSAFKDMFTLPPDGRASIDGSSDDAPLVLSDTAKGFRALLWLLYALPHELQIKSLPDGKTEPGFDILLAATEMSNKYHFASLELWAISSIFQIATTYPFDTTSSPLLAQIMTVAFRCNDYDLQQFIGDLWVKLIYSSGMSPIPALTVSDKFGMRRLQGMAYYAQLLSMECMTERSSVPLKKISGCEGLTEAQLFRVLSGHWSLSEQSERLFKAPITFPQRSHCPPAVHCQCVRSWETMWMQAAANPELLRMRPTRLMARLLFIQKLIINSMAILPPNAFLCRENALTSLRTLIGDMQTNLWEHFSGFTLNNDSDS